MKELTFFEAVEQRVSIRSYKDQPVDQALLDKILEAGLAAPTARNLQDLRFMVVTNPSVLAEISERKLAKMEAEGDLAGLDRMKKRHDSVLYDAPVCIIISGPKRDLCEVDAGIAVQTMSLAAKALGLDSVMIGMTRDVFAADYSENLRRAIQLPDDHEVFISLALGYRNMDKEQHQVKPDIVAYLP